MVNDPTEFMHLNSSFATAGASLSIAIYTPDIEPGFFVMNCSEKGERYIPVFELQHKSI
jgi:hypothetical protein